MSEGRSGTGPSLMPRIKAGHSHISSFDLACMALWVSHSPVDSCRGFHSIIVSIWSLFPQVPRQTQAPTKSPLHNSALPITSAPPRHSLPPGAGEPQPAGGGGDISILRGLSALGAPRVRRLCGGAHSGSIDAYPEAPVPTLDVVPECSPWIQACQRAVRVVLSFVDLYAGPRAIRPRGNNNNTDASARGAYAFGGGGGLLLSGDVLEFGIRASRELTDLYPARTQPAPELGAWGRLRRPRARAQWYGRWRSMFANDLAAFPALVAQARHISARGCSKLSFPAGHQTHACIGQHSNISIASKRRYLRMNQQILTAIYYSCTYPAGWLAGSNHELGGIAICTSSSTDFPRSKLRFIITLLCVFR
ncbi:hypothetical protein C8R44DRAFT_901275 [Mycena epipterygia]|nr:hypothetical protein C8R44DRAFT_901275 [Mycena epipterygia]